MGQKYAAYNAQGAIVGFYDSEDSPVPVDVTAIKISDAEWTQCLSTQSYTVQNGALVAPAAPTDEELLSAAQAAKVADLSAACSAEIMAGFTSSALGDAYSYPAKDTDQRNLASSVFASLMPGIDPTWVTPFWCADEAGNWELRPHTAAQIQRVGTDARAAIVACMTKNAALAGEVTSSVSVEEVDLISW